MFGMWMEDLGEEQSDVDDVSPSMVSFPWRRLLRYSWIPRCYPISSRGRRKAYSWCKLDIKDINGLSGTTCHATD